MPKNFWRVFVFYCASGQKRFRTTEQKENFISVQCNKKSFNVFKSQPEICISNSDRQSQFTNKFFKVNEVKFKCYAKSVQIVWNDLDFKDKNIDYFFFFISLFFQINTLFSWKLNKCNIILYYFFSDQPNRFGLKRSMKRCQISIRPPNLFRIGCKVSPISR